MWCLRARACGGGRGGGSSACLRREVVASPLVLCGGRGAHRTAGPRTQQQPRAHVGRSGPACWDPFRSLASAATPCVRSLVRLACEHGDTDP
eukprot:6986757-Prymnesium_polylepis.1